MGNDFFIKASSFKNKTKVLASVFITIFLIIIFFIVNDYFVYIDKSKTDTFHKLEAIANTSSTFIDAEIHEKITKAYLNKDDITSVKQDSLYHELYLILKRIQKLNHIKSHIYTLIKQGDQFHIIITTNEKPMFRHLYHDPHPLLFEKYNEGSTIDKHKSENEMLLSAFAPLKKDNGEVIAILNIDQEFDGFITNARNELLRNLLFSMAFFGIVSFILFRYLKIAFKKSEEFQKRVIEQNREIKEKKEEIESINAALKENNNKILKANSTIEEKNEALRGMNEYLDHIVNERTRDLKQTNMELNIFLYRASHDIVGPIATMQGLCNVAMFDVKDKKAHGYIEKFTHTANRLKHIVNGMRMIYEINDKDPETKKLDLVKVIETVTEEQAAITNRKDIPISIEVEEGLEVYTDEQIFKMILSEMIRNSLEHLDNDDPKITISLQADKNYLSVLINDNGDGIDPHIKEKLIRNLRKGSMFPEGGPGMGFNVVKRALNKLDGDIEILDKDEPGTSFKFRVLNRTPR